MRLNDTTQLQMLLNGRYIAIHEGGTSRSSQAAKIVSIINQDVFRCGWLIQDGFTEDGDAVIRECGAFAVGFDNGFTCLNGHDHRNDAEYFDAEEIEAARNGGHPLPLNARMI